MRLTVPLAAYFTGVPERTVRRWAMLERLTVDDDGLVDPDEVLELDDMRKETGGRNLPRSA